MPVQQIFAGELIPNSTNLSDWFQGASYLFFVAPDRPDWSVDGSFTEIDAALLVEVPGGLTRQVPLALGQITTREPILVPSELVRSGARMRLVLDASFAVALEGYAVSEATIAAIVTSLTLRERADGSAPIDPREATIDSASGVLSVGKDGGPAWRYLPEGYGPPTATAEALQQLADDLASLRAIAATDEDLAAEVAALEDAIDGVIASGSTDSELSAALAPIQSAIGTLTSQDSATATAIAAVQASIAGLDAVYATDVQLAQAVSGIRSEITEFALSQRDKNAELEGMIGLGLADLGLPIRSTAAPALTTNVRWVELKPDGSEKYPWAWTAVNRGTAQTPAWEWQGLNGETVAAFSVSVSNVAISLRQAPPWTRRGTRWRLNAISTIYFGQFASSAGAWTLFLGFEDPTGQINLSPALPNWTLAANVFPSPVAGDVAPNLILGDLCRGFSLSVSPSGSVSRLVQGSVALSFVPVRL